MYIVMSEAYKSSLIRVRHKHMDRCSCRHSCILGMSTLRKRVRNQIKLKSVKSKPSETPEDIRQVSVSFRGVVIRL